MNTISTNLTEYTLNINLTAQDTIYNNMLIVNTNTLHLSLNDDNKPCLPLEFISLCSDGYPILV